MDLSNKQNGIGTCFKCGTFFIVLARKERKRSERLVVLLSRRGGWLDVRIRAIESIMIIFFILIRVLPIGYDIKPGL